MVKWSPPAVVITSFNVSTYYVWTTRPVVVSWTSNAGPCSIAGGGLSVSNLPASGSHSITQSTPGDVNYTLTCGSAGDQDDAGFLITYVTPAVLLEANSTDRILGQPFTLYWLAYRDSCTPSGGASGDGWTSAKAFSSGQMNSARKFQTSERTPTRSPAPPDRYPFNKAWLCNSNRTPATRRCLSIAPP